MRLGLMSCNGQPMPSWGVLRAGDLLSHASHRHEPPVAYVRAADMVVYDDGDLIVLNKPATVPVHPCGGYMLNSCLLILKHELGLDNLHTVHRLDRMTSGLCILSRSSATAVRFQHALARRSDAASTRKTYLALVRGRFPRSPEDFAPPVWTNSSEAWPESAVSWPDAGCMRVSFPIRVLDPRKGVHECSARGRASTSRFRFVAFDPATQTSLVCAEPETGRTHQLRLHLQLVGFPVANDYAYGGEDEFAPSLPPAAAAAAAADDDTDLLEEEEASSLSTASLEQQVLASCAACAGKVGSGQKRPSGISLHAFRFRLFENQVQTMDFHTPLPRWCPRDVSMEALLSM
jgi:tRNA pseudouridine synthase 9